MTAVPGSLKLGAYRATPRRVHAVKPSLTVPVIGLLPLSRLSKRLFILTAVSESRLLAGSSTRPRSGAFTFTIKDVATEVSALLWATRLMVITPKVKLSSSTTAVISTGVPIVSQVLKKGPRWLERLAMVAK